MNETDDGGLGHATCHDSQANRWEGEALREKVKVEKSVSYGLGRSSALWE